MTVQIEACARRVQSDDLIVKDIAGELMLYNKAKNKAFCLNKTASFVWQHADGNTSVPEIAELLAQEMNLPVDVQVVELAIQSLEQDGLLEPAEDERTYSSGVTRRDLIRKYGVRAALALPVVTMLTVATRKAHASGWTSDGDPHRPR